VQKRSINLTFHGIGEPPRQLEPGEGDVWVSQAAFLALLDSAAGRDDVRITFDDGNASDVEIAMPALLDRDLSATFFVVAGRLGSPGFLDHVAVHELTAAGMEIGSHGMHHRRWRGLDEPALQEELVQAKAVLENVLERPITRAACPFGSYDRRVLRTLRHAGFERAYTSDRGTAVPDAVLQARNTVGPADGADLLGRALALDASTARALPRRAKLAVKRWR
jgi:peptidoglycan/xylan/chitin deacetylase (PgdA/CDA1 family)